MSKLNRHIISLNEYEIPSGLLGIHLEASRSKLRKSLSVHPFAIVWRRPQGVQGVQKPGHPIELPTMTRTPKATIIIVACVISEYGEQRRFRIKVDVFDSRVFN